MAALTIRQLGKRFHRSSMAVHDVSFHVADRECLAIVGPSGCGKSTLLRMIAGLERPTSGQVIIDDRDVTWLAPRERNLNMVLQGENLYPQQTVAANLSFAARLRGASRAECREIAEAVAEQLEIAAWLDRYPAELSGGERQVVAIGRLFAYNTPITLWDEPLSQVDPHRRRALREAIIDHHQRHGTTMIYVTHDQSEAMSLGQRIAVMHHGQFEQLDTPDQLYHFPASLAIATFVGDPPMNLVRGEVTEGQFVAETWDWTIPAPSSAGRSVVVGVRSEDLAVGRDDGPGWQGNVTRNERHGGGWLVHMRNGDHHFLARWPIDSTLPSVGRQLTWCFSTDSLYFFDGSTGRLLHAPRRA